MAAAEILLELSLRQADSLVAVAANYALSLEDLEGIELPPASSGEADQAQLRAVAALYLASELEEAGVIATAEALTRLSGSGGLAVDLGGGAPLLQSFWQARNERATEEERRGFYSALFGTGGGTDHSEQPSNQEFENRLIDLCEALYKLDEQASNTSWGSVAQQARLRATARGLLENLVRASGGMTVFIAQEILSTLRVALAILNHKDVKAAFGAWSPWDVVAAVDRRMRRSRGDSDLRVRRGRSGMTILAWLAEAAPHLANDNRPIVGLDNPVIPAALEWLQASLELSDAGAPQPADASPATWADLAG